MQEIIKDILPSDDELEINNDNDLLQNVDEVDDGNNSYCGKPMAMKQIKNILYKSCIFSLKAGVLLLGHLLLSLLKILALIWSYRFVYNLINLSYSLYLHCKTHVQ